MSSEGKKEESPAKFDKGERDRLQILAELRDIIVHCKELTHRERLEYCKSQLHFMKRYFMKRYVVLPLLLLVFAMVRSIFNTNMLRDYFQERKKL